MKEAPTSHGASSLSELTSNGQGQVIELNSGDSIALC